MLPALGRGAEAGSNEPMLKTFSNCSFTGGPADPPGHLVKVPPGEGECGARGAGCEVMPGVHPLTRGMHPRPQFPPKLHVSVPALKALQATRAAHKAPRRRV